MNTSTDILKKGFFLHASAALLPKGAMLFIGHSSSGKSTIIRLMENCFPALADDSVFLRKRLDECYVINDGNIRFLNRTRNDLLNSPSTTDDHQVLGISRLFQSNVTRAERISPRQLCQYLTDSLFELDIQHNCKDINLRKRLFKNVAELARQIPGWHLWFSLDMKPGKLLEVLFPGKCL